MIRIPYHRNASFVVLRPIDGRVGQLATGALVDSASEIDLGSVPNSIHLQVGDLLYFISDASELSGNSGAEVVSNNTGGFEITDIDGTSLQLGSTFNSEPNSTSAKFFEFKVVRPSPYRKFTFRRVAQTIFTPVVCVNGEVIAPVMTNPSGAIRVATWDGGVLRFTPLGSDRWSCEMDISIDGTIDVDIDSGGVELQLSNMNVLSDIPLALMEYDVTRFGPYVASSLQVLRRLGGDRYVNEWPTGAELQLITVESQLLKAVAGSSNEFLCSVTDRKTGRTPNLEGSVIFFELRDANTQDVVVYKQAEWLSSGLVRTILDPGESVSGAYYLTLECHRGGVPAVVQRTNAILIRVVAS